MNDGQRANTTPRATDAAPGERIDRSREIWWTRRLESANRSLTNVDSPLDERISEFWGSGEFSLDDRDRSTAEGVPASPSYERFEDPPESIAPTAEIAVSLIESLRNHDVDRIPDSTTIDDVVEDIPGVGSKIQSWLNRSGYDTVGDLRSADRADLTTVPRVGPDKADRLKEFVGDSDELPSGADSDSESTDFDDGEAVEDLHEEISGLGQASCGKLASAGYETVGELRSATREELLEVTQIGPGTVDTLEEHCSD